VEEFRRAFPAISATGQKVAVYRKASLRTGIRKRERRLRMIGAGRQRQCEKKGNGSAGKWMHLWD
jgi:hypothetical protein